MGMKTVRTGVILNMSSMSGLIKLLMLALNAATGVSELVFGSVG